MKKTLHDVDLDGKRVLVRVDYNVPQRDDGGIADNTRIRETLPTLRYILKRARRVVLVSHLGRPDGQVVPKLSLAPISVELQSLLGRAVAFATDTVGPAAHKKADELPPGGVLLLENVRFHTEEEANDPAFAAELARFGDIFVNDAFGTAHRAHASTAGVAAYLPAVAGLLMERELAAMERVLHNPVRPLVAVIGGAKVSSKIGVLEHLLPRVDALVIGGGMACTFLKAQGYDVGRSLLEEDRVAFAGELIQRAKERGGRLLLPVDGLYVDRIDDPTFKSLAQVSAIPPGSMMVDIGPQSVAAFSRALSEARTTLWNGPMGIFERPDYAEGTRAIAEAIAGSGATTVAGGGDTVAAIELFSDASRFTHVSTGGGATLELLEGRVLPGVAALLDRP